MGNSTKGPKILFYDIETSPLKAWIWSLGDQVVRHHQLVEGYDQFGIICIAYAWEKGPVHVLDWGLHKQDSAKVVKEFDKIVRQADIVIGKNSDRFDAKMLNTQRLIHGLDPMPEWINFSDDLEKQLRKYFRLPSYGLDYISKIRGLGGKRKMEMQDWIDIVENKDEKKFRKMKLYNKKDVADTRELWNWSKSHFIPKFNMATFHGDNRCRNCGSQNLKKSGTRPRGKTRYQMFFCKDHGGYAGQAPISTTGKIGKIG